MSLVFSVYVLNISQSSCSVYVLLLSSLPMNCLQCPVVKPCYQHLLIADPAPNKAGEDQDLTEIQEKTVRIDSKIERKGMIYNDSLMTYYDHIMTYDDRIQPAKKEYDGIRVSNPKHIQFPKILPWVHPFSKKLGVPSTCSMSQSPHLLRLQCSAFEAIQRVFLLQRSHKNKPCSQDTYCQN